MDGYDRQVEQGWPYGAFQSGSVEGIPAGGAARLYDGYYDDQGQCERRGGSVRKSSAALTSGGPKWILDARLVAGQRTAFPSSTVMSSLDSNDTSYHTILSVHPPRTAVRPAVVRGIMFWVVDAGGVDQAYGWAGSRNIAGVSAGTLAVNRGATLVTGTGTLWLANLAAGDILQMATGWGVVEAVVSNTSLRLSEPYSGASTTGAAYTRYNAVNAAYVSSGALVAALGSVAGRLVIGRGTQAAFSPLTGPYNTWDETDQHSFPAQLLGFGNIRDTAIAFTTEGTYAVYNMALNLTDSAGNPQHRVERINDELVLWGQFGIANWQGSLIAPMLDGIYIIDTVGKPQKISGPIEDNYLSRVRDLYQPGQATVYNGHYFLPILGYTGIPQDMLVCRLTPNSAGRAGQWSWHRGHGGGGNVRGLAVRAPTAAGVAPLLLAAGEDGYISTLRHFEPQATYKSDGDAVAHVLEIQTRAFPSGNGNINTVRFVTLSYTLTDAATDDPTVDCYYALDGSTTWTAATAGGTGAETSGTIGKKVWRIDRDCRIIQFRFRTANAAATAKFRGIEIQVHRSGRV